MSSVRIRTGTAIAGALLIAGSVSACSGTATSTATTTAPPQLPTASSAAATANADTPGRPEVCTQFDAIAYTIESPGSAGRRARAVADAEDSGRKLRQTAVAAAAQSMLNGKASSDPSQWYTGLGQMEAACPGSALAIRPGSATRVLSVSQWVDSDHAVQRA